jgi:hypothetical protein
MVVDDGPHKSVQKNRNLLVETDKSLKNKAKIQGNLNGSLKEDEVVELTLESPESAMTFLDTKDAKKARLVTQKTAIDKAN